MTTWSHRWLGLPWLDKGRIRAGCDCWGLGRLVLREEARYDVPSYDDAYLSAAEQAEIAALIGREAASPLWRAVDRPEPFDIAVFRRGRLDSHVAIVTEYPDRVLHMVEGEWSRIDRIDDVHMRRRLVGFQRWHGGVL